MADPILVALQLQQPAGLTLDVTQLNAVDVDLSMDDALALTLQSNGVSFDLTMQDDEPLLLNMTDSGVTISVTDVGKAGPVGPRGPEGPPGELDDGVIIDGGFF